MILKLFHANFDAMLWDNSFCPHIFKQTCTYKYQDCLKAQVSTRLSRGKTHCRCLSLFPISNIKKENCLHRESLWNHLCWLVCGFLQFPLSSALTKQASFCSCFRRKATLLKYDYIQSVILPITKFQSGWWWL